MPVTGMTLPGHAVQELSIRVACDKHHGFLAGVANIVATQPSPSAEAIADHTTLSPRSALSTHDTAVTPVPAAQPHVTTGIWYSPTSAIQRRAEVRSQQQQTSGHNDTVHPTAVDSSPLVLVLRLAPATRRRSGTTATENSARGPATGTAAALNPAQAPAPLLPSQQLYQTSGHQASCQGALGLASLPLLLHLLLQLMQSTLTRL